MSNYYLILAWIGVFAILTLFVQMNRRENLYGKTVYRIRPIWAVVLVAPLVIWSADRGYVGDTYAYMKGFQGMPTELSKIGAYMESVSKDKAFYFMAAVIKSIITENVHIYFLIIAAIQAFLLFRIYRKYSTRYAVSFFLFIVSTDYISWMFNGMRQFVAVTITLLAFESIVEKKYIKAIIIVLLASLFHQSALLVIPFIFVIQGEAWNVKTLLYMAVVVVVILYVDRFTDILDELLQETQYENVVSDWELFEDDGTNVLRVLVYAVPTILSLVGLRYIKAENSSIINICTNMSIISMGIYIISMFTSGIYIGRLPIYFSLYNYILLPWEIDQIFDKRSAKMVYVIMAVAYLGFYMYSIRNL